jgi:hypothetical protein
MIMGINRGLALGALVVLACGPVRGAEMDGRLTGAWATSQADCKRLFVRGGGGLAFRQPVDQFAQAAIITRGTVTLPNQTCQVTGASQAGGLTKLEFQCRDSISYTSQTVEIEVKSGTSMVYRPNGDKTLDTALIKCGAADTDANYPSPAGPAHARPRPVTPNLSGPRPPTEMFPQ